MSEKQKRVGETKVLISLPSKIIQVLDMTAKKATEATGRRHTRKSVVEGLLAEHLNNLINNAPKQDVELVDDRVS